MLFDLHIHQDLHSKDSKLDIFEAIEEAKALGLDGIGITDHDDLGLKKRVNEIMMQTGFMVVVGVEIYTLDGDLLVYGIDEMPETRMSAQETIQYVHERGGVCIAAHPYRHNNRGLGSLIETIEGLDAIEVYNGRTDQLSNERAYDVAKVRNIPMTGSSDAHGAGEVGQYVTRFDGPIHSEIDLVRAIRAGQCQPEFIEKKTEKSA